MQWLNHVLHLIVTKLGTDTNIEVANKRMLTDLPKVACRGRCCSEIFRYVCEKFDIFYPKNLKKLPKIRAITTHLSALRSSLNVYIWRKYREKNHFKSMDLAKIRHNALSI